MKMHPRPGTALVGSSFIVLVIICDTIFKTTILFDHTRIVIIISCIIGLFAHDYFSDRYEDDWDDNRMAETKQDDSNMKKCPRLRAQGLVLLFFSLVIIFDRIFKTTVFLDHIIIIIVIGCVIDSFAYNYFSNWYANDLNDSDGITRQGNDSIKPPPKHGGIVLSLIFAVMVITFDMIFSFCF